MIKIRAYLKISSAAAVILFFASILIFVITATAAEREKIRVGVTNIPGQITVDENGNYSGYSYEYLQEIAQYTGWDYEFITVEGSDTERISKIMEMAKNGEIDIMTDLIYAESLNDVYDYSGQSYGTSNTVLNTLEENTYINGNNYHTFDVLRVATFQSATTRIKELDQFCINNNINYELVYCFDEEDFINSLKENRADVILDVDTNTIFRECVRTVAKFSPRPYYFVTAKGNKDIIQKINSAILSINEADPYFSVTLYEKYYGTQNKDFSLSDEDKEFIKALEPLKTAVLLNDPPFQYIDNETGEIKGISIDMLNFVSEKTGIEFEIVTAETSEQIENMANNNEIDIIAKMTYDYNNSEKYNSSLSRPYISTQYLLILNGELNENSIKGKKLALPKDSPYKGYFIGDVRKFDTVKDCIDAVSKGEADYMYTNVYTAQYYLNTPHYSKLNVVNQSYQSYNACIGIVTPERWKLLTIINKAILSMTLEEKESIVYSNVVHNNEYYLRHWIEANTPKVITAIICFFALVISIMSVVLYERLKLSKKIEMDIKKHYELYELSNERFFEYDYVEDVLILSNDSIKSSPNIVIKKFASGKEEEVSHIIKGYKEMLNNIIKAMNNGIEDIRYEKEDGSNSWIRVIYKTIFDDRSKPVYVIGKLVNIEHEKKEKDELLTRAQKDSLTGIYNVAASKELIMNKIKNIGPDEKGAFFILDVDNFKTINDSMGHYTGDEVLQNVSKAITSAFRKGDIIGRLGGDEFVIYMDNIDSIESLDKKCKLLCNKIRNIDTVSGKIVTSSVGVTVAEHGVSYDQLYRQADKALYYVKNHGRNGYKIM